ncbi:MAG: polyprenol monophosphomannose synthase [Dehalococcoidia bacterium]|nr:polyprenol monophosphomannose synthase [Dehalococcoidia bacterium]
MKYVVVIGTYNEAENIPGILPEILSQGPEYEAIVVDDNSPDGTGRLVAEMAAKQPRIHVVHRAARIGYGSAYLEGFRAALDLGADYIVQMDADYSHNPTDISRLVEAAKDADLAIGSRYVKGGSTEGWPFRRRLISRGGNMVAHLLLALPIRDCTGGFKCFPRATLESLNFSEIRSRGFASLYEINYACHRSGKKFREVPINFVERRTGQSKMTWGMIAEALVVMLRLRLWGGRARKAPRAR